MLSDSDKRTLLRIAREAIAARLRAIDRPSVEATGALATLAGAFVTLRRGDALRGCIGCVERERPLADVVASSAVAAATEDPRFLPVEWPELELVRLEVSVLGDLEMIDPADASQLDVGRHGLMIQRGARRGLLLPQVATECGWDRETFLAQTCLKAGLSPDAWKSNAQVFRFDAEVFGEE